MGGPRGLDKSIRAVLDQRLTELAVLCTSRGVPRATCPLGVGKMADMDICLRVMLCSTYRFHPEDRYSTGPRPATFMNSSTP